MFCATHPQGPVALEVQGSQHYAYCEMHRSLRDFHEQKYRDRVKARLCRQHGVKLIVVPFWKRHELEPYLRSEFARLGVDVSG